MMVPFVTVDVFTDRQFGGNQLAVVPDARGLLAAQMQAIATEFGYSETTFVLPPSDPDHTARVRIFTPAHELPFAGHPNVGTAFVLARAGAAFGRAVGTHIIFEETAGLVAIDVLSDQSGPTGAIITAPQPLRIVGPASVGVIARCVGLDPSDIMTTHHDPMVASVGTLFVFAEIESASLTKCAPNVAAFRAELPIHEATGIHVYARTDASHVQCRMFAPWAGVIEDAATGSANVALTALLAHLAPEANLQLDLEIRQGVEMGRPSLLHGEATKRDGQVIKSRIGGTCVPVMEGRFTLQG